MQRYKNLPYLQRDKGEFSDLEWSSAEARSGCDGGQGGCDGGHDDFQDDFPNVVLFHVLVFL